MLPNQVPEKKDLVIDPQLMKPLDHIAGATFLKVCYESMTATVEGSGLLKTHPTDSKPRINSLFGSIFGGFVNLKCC